MKNIIAIIPSAGNPQNQLFPGIYDPMIPINGKPAIEYILGNLIKLGFLKAIIILNVKDSKSYNYLLFRKFNIDLVLKKVNTNSLGKSIYSVKDLILNKKVFIHLGDSIFTGDFNFCNSTILIQNKKVLDPKKWCFSKYPPAELVDTYFF